MNTGGAHTTTMYWESLRDLLQLLEVEGWRLDAQQYVHVQRIVEKTESWPQLRYRVGALLCKTEQEQERFYGLFDTILPYEADMLSEIVEYQVRTEKLRTRIVGDKLTEESEEIHPENKVESTESTVETKTNSKSILYRLIGLNGLIVALGLGLHLFDGWELVVLLITLPLSIGIVLYQLYKEQRPLLQLAAEAEIDHFRALRLPDYQLVNFGQGFRQLSRQLRKRKLSDVPVLDIYKTVRNTIRAGGVLQPQYRFRTEPPSYLVLIDYTHPQNHRTRLYEMLYHWLRDQQVPVSRYFYRNDPRHCWNENEPQGMPLRKLAQHYAQDRLLIFGDGWAFLHPAEPGLANWASALLVWEDRTLLSPIGVKQWSQREVYLQSVFQLAPATEEGLRQVSQGVGQQTVTVTDKDLWTQEGSVEIRPDFFAADLQNALPDPDLQQWLATLSCFPQLHWKLTLYLGEWLSEKLDTDLLQFDKLRQLSRLSWFYNGYFPPEVRKRLYDSLAEERRKEIHAHIYQWLQQQAQESDRTWHEGEQFELQLALQKLAAGLSTEAEIGQLRRQLATSHYLEVRYGQQQEEYDTEVPQELIAQIPRLGRELVWTDLWRRLLTWFGVPEGEQQPWRYWWRARFAWWYRWRGDGTSSENEPIAVDTASLIQSWGSLSEAQLLQKAWAWDRFRFHLLNLRIDGVANDLAELLVDQNNQYKQYCSDTLVALLESLYDPSAAFVKSDTSKLLNLLLRWSSEDEAFIKSSLPNLTFEKIRLRKSLRDSVANINTIVDPKYTITLSSVDALQHNLAACSVTTHYTDFCLSEIKLALSALVSLTTTNRVGNNLQERFSVIFNPTEVRRLLIVLQSNDPIPEYRTIAQVKELCDKIVDALEASKADFLHTISSSSDKGVVEQREQASTVESQTVRQLIDSRERLVNNNTVVSDDDRVVMVKLRVEMLQMIKNIALQAPSQALELARSLHVENTTVDLQYKLAVILDERTILHKRRDEGTLTVVEFKRQSDAWHSQLDKLLHDFSREVASLPNVETLLKADELDLAIAELNDYLKKHNLQRQLNISRALKERLKKLEKDQSAGRLRPEDFEEEWRRIARQLLRMTRAIEEDEDGSVLSGDEANVEIQEEQQVSKEQDSNLIIEQIKGVAKKLFTDGRDREAILLIKNSLSPESTYYKEIDALAAYYGQYGRNQKGDFAGEENWAANQEQLATDALQILDKLSIEDLGFSSQETNISIDTDGKTTITSTRQVHLSFDPSAFQERLKFLVSKNNLGKAFEMLLDQLSPDSELHSDSRLLSGELKRILREQAQGILSNEEASKGTASIASNILNLIQELSTSDFVKTARGNTRAQQEVKEPSITFKIMVLSADPSDTANLIRESEHRAISDRLASTSQGEHFVLQGYGNDTVDRFTHRLIREQPQIVHFSANTDNIEIEVEKNLTGNSIPGVYLQENRKLPPSLISAIVLANIFSRSVFAASRGLQLVVFNGCHNESQVEAVAKVVPYVITVRNTVGDKERRDFAAHFYQALAHSGDIKKAFSDAISFGIISSAVNIDQFLLYENGRKIER